MKEIDMKRYYYEKYRQPVTEYDCKNKIYYYCSKPFIYFNKTYPSGYYDDRNKYYYNVAFTNGKSHIKCNHCGSRGLWSCCLLPTSYTQVQPTMHS